MAGDVVGTHEISEGPASRHGAATLWDRGTLYVAGGMQDGEPLNDVWALDVDAGSARQLAELSRARAKAVIQRPSSTTIRVIGGAQCETAFVGCEGVPSVVEIGRGDGEVRDVPVSGPWPPGNGYFLTGWTMGDEVIVIAPGESASMPRAGRPELWRLQFEDGEAHWTGGKPCDPALTAAADQGVGIATGPAESYLVGSHLLRLQRE